MNVIGFEDSAIGYEVIDEVVKRTNGLPYQVGLVKEKDEKIVNTETISHLNFEMITGFSESTK